MGEASLPARWCVHKVFMANHTLHSSPARSSACPGLRQFSRDSELLSGRGVQPPTFLVPENRSLPLVALRRLGI